MKSWLVRKRNQSTRSKHSQQYEVSSVHSSFLWSFSIIFLRAACSLFLAEVCMICHKELASTISLSKETEQCESSQKSTLTQYGQKYCYIFASVKKSMPQRRMELLLICRGGLTSRVTSRRSTQQRFFSSEKLWKNLRSLRLRILSFSQSVPAIVCLMDRQKDYHQALRQRIMYLLCSAGVVSMRRLGWVFIPFISQLQCLLH